MRLVDRIGSGEGRIALLSSMVEGAIIAAPALYEPGRRYALTPTVRAAGVPDGYLLSGAKVLVPGGGRADRLLVTAMLDDGGIGLFAIDPAAPCTALSSYITIDGSPVADVDFREVPLAADGLVGRIDIDQIEQFLDEARLALCADALGGLERAIEMTSEYLATRTQFGTPLAHFQALQHTLVEMFIETDSMRSSLYQAIAAFHDGDDATRRRAVSSCWVKTFDAAKEVAGMAVHLHGGIGLTTEYQVGNYLRRMMVSERSFGDVEYHFGRYMELADSDRHRA
jgi:acyl-CoA dehydrogenase